MTQIHDSTTCTAGFDGQPCEMCQFALKTPSEPSSRAGIAQDVESVKMSPTRPSDSGIAISVPCGHVLYVAGKNCQVFHSEDRQCPVCDGGLAVCRLCSEYEAGLDEPCKRALPSTTISAPDFDQEWESAPSARRRHTEQEDAFFWFMRGVRCGQLGQMLEDNRVFRQMAEQRGLR